MARQSQPGSHSINGIDGNILMKKFNQIIYWMISLTYMCALFSGRIVFAESLYTVRFESRQFEYSDLNEMAGLTDEANLSQAELKEAVNNLFKSLAREGYPLASISYGSQLHHSIQLPDSIYLSLLASYAQ